MIVGVHVVVLKGGVAIYWGGSQCQTRFCPRPQSEGFSTCPTPDAFSLARLADVASCCHQIPFNNVNSLVDF